MYKKIIEQLVEYFTAGFFILLPLVVTFGAIKIVSRFAVSCFSPLINLVPACLRCIPYSEVILGLTLIILTGYIIKKFFLERILHTIENALFKKIPIIKHIYFGIKQVIHIINKQKNQTLDQQVAWVRLPYKGVYCLGFMTGILDVEAAPTKDKIYYCFFVPSTPNPVTGYFVIATEEEFVFTSLTRQEAMSLVISGGIIRPDKE